MVNSEVLLMKTKRLQAMIWFETIKKWFFSEAKLSGVFACRGIEPTLGGVTSGVAMVKSLLLKPEPWCLTQKLKELQSL